MGNVEATKVQKAGEESPSHPDTGWPRLFQEASTYGVRKEMESTHLQVTREKILQQWY